MKTSKVNTKKFRKTRKNMNKGGRPMMSRQTGTNTHYDNELETILKQDYTNVGVKCNMVKGYLSVGANPNMKMVDELKNNEIVTPIIYVSLHIESN